MFSCYYKNALPFICLLILVSFVSSCGYDYKGYMTRSYTIRGKHYQPMTVQQGLKYRESGIASWYDESSFFGLIRGNTSLGEKVYPWHLSAAHKTLPLPAKIRVTNLKNGKKVTLRVNDRGPFIAGRILDVTPRAARKLGFQKQGLTDVYIEVLSIGDGKYKKSKKRRKFFFFF